MPTAKIKPTSKRNDGISTLYSSDADTIRTITAYKQRKNYRTWAEALDKFVAAGKSLGLDERDIGPRDITISN